MTNGTGNIYPPLLKVADAASASAQRMHFGMLRAELTLLGVGAASNVAAVWMGHKIAAAWIAAALLFASFFISWVNKARRYERRWFDCRAVAESIKSLTWRYLTKADPFEKLDGTDAERAFVDAIGKARRERDAAKAALAAHQTKTPEVITEHMRRIRGQSAADRAETYEQKRLLHQIAWYGSRATSSSGSEGAWFWITATLQATTLVIAVAIASSNFEVSALPILTTLVAGATAWSRAKRFGDLAQTYRVAEHELIELREKKPPSPDDASLAKWVEEVELLVSREHMMWFAKLQS